MKNSRYLFIFISLIPIGTQAKAIKKEQLLIKNKSKCKAPKKAQVKPQQLVKSPKQEKSLKKTLTTAKKNDPEEKIKIKNKASVEISKKAFNPKKPRTITFTNSITEKMVTYTGHWYKPSPSIFHVSINNQEFVTRNKKGKMEVHNKQFALSESKTIKARYEWIFEKFGKQWHSEEKEIEFEIPDDLSELEIGFGFDTDYRISISQAKRIAWRDVRPPKTTR